MPAQHLGEEAGLLRGPAQVHREGGADADLLAVERGASRVEQVEGVADLVAGTGRRAGVPADRHGDAGEDQRLGEHGEELVVAASAGVAQHGLAGGTGHGGGQAVDGLTVDLVRELPVGDRRDVGDRVTDAGADEPDRGFLDHVEVDHHGDRRRHTVGTAAVVVVQDGHRRADAVVREVGGDGHHGQPDPRRGVLGHVDDLAAAQAHDGVVAAALYVVGQLDRGVDGAVDDRVPVGVRQHGLQLGAQRHAGASADRDGQLAGGGDPLVGQEAGQVVHRPATDVDDDGRGDEPRQYWHAIVRPLARSSWLSISTHLTSPMGATSMVKPSLTSCW